MIKARKHKVGEPFSLSCKGCDKVFESKHSNALLRLCRLSQQITTNLRERLIIINYHIRHTQTGKWSITDYSKSVKETLARYKAAVKQINEKKNERKGLQNEKKSTSVFNIAAQ